MRRQAAKAADAGDKAEKADQGEKIGKMPHLEFNVKERWVRVECEALAVNAPLEFYCCLNGTNEHESVLRSAVRPRDLHTALLAIGLQPGEPLTYSEAMKKWLPPHGPPLRINVEFEKNGKAVSYPAYRWLRDVKSKKECPAFNWVFCGSRVMKNGHYAADDTGYLLTLVNFDFAVIDVPQIASSNNDLLEWERNPDLMPEKGAKVWMLIEPLGKEGAAPAAPPAAGHASPAPAATPGGASALPASPAPGAPAAAAVPATGPVNGQTLAEIQAVKTDEAKVQAMIQMHERVMGPRAQALREAAQAHYEVIETLRKEQQRLITEADLIQRAIDDLEKKYQDLTTPQPAPPPASGGPAGGATGEPGEQPGPVGGAGAGALGRPAQ